MLVDPLECACAEGPASQQAACQQAPAASACASSEGPFEAAFAPWPIRFYVLWRGRVAYKAQVGWPVGGAGSCTPRLLCTCAATTPPPYMPRICPCCCTDRSLPPLPIPSPPTPSQPRDCSYDLSELRARLLQLLAEASAGRFAAAATPAGGQQAQQA